jgi:ABC-type uncharacterized transport system auxiliary subunit
MRWCWLLLLAGCALTAKSKPLEIEYYAPVIATTQAEKPRGPLPRLRLGRIEPSSYLRTEIAYRSSAVEVGLYDTRRWTDSPDVYVERSLEHALFDQRPIEQVTGGEATTLEVDVLAFEEVVAPSGGRVQLAYRLRDDDLVVASGVVTVKRVARGVGFPAVVTAIGAALDAATAQVADAVLKHLTKRARPKGEVPQVGNL